MNIAIQYLRLSEVARRLGLSKRTVTRMVERGDFPRPVHPSPGTRAWIEAEAAVDVRSARSGNPRPGADDVMGGRSGPDPIKGWSPHGSSSAQLFPCQPDFSARGGFLMLSKPQPHRAPTWFSRSEKHAFRRLYSAFEAANMPLSEANADLLADYVSARSRIRQLNAMLTKILSSENLFAPAQRHAMALSRQIDATATLSHRIAIALNLAEVMSDDRG